jgi:hypothetical protein
MIQNEWIMVTSIFAKVEIYETKQKDEFRRQKTEEGWANTEITRNMDRRDLSTTVLASLAQQVRADLSGVLAA